MSFFGLHLTLFIGPTIPMPAPPSLINSFQSVEVWNSDQGPDGFQITFAAGRSGGAAADIFDDPLLNKPLLRPFNRVIIMVTFGVVQKVLIDGIITHQQLTPAREPGKSTFTVTGEDLSVVMDMEEKNHTKPNTSDDDVVDGIIRSYAKYGLDSNVVRLPLNVPTDVDWIPTYRGTDRSYIQELATKNAYIFYIEPTDVREKCKAYWGPPSSSSSSLLPQMRSLSVNMGSNTNVDSINFQYNAIQPQQVSALVDNRVTDSTIPVEIFKSSRFPLSSKPAWLVNFPNVRKVQLDYGLSGMDALEAYQSAQAQMDNSVEAVVATGEIDSLVYGDVLRARRIVELRGAGDSFDGLYFIKNVTHNIKIGEYKQSFTLSREGLGSITPVVRHD